MPERPSSESSAVSESRPSVDAYEYTGGVSGRHDVHLSDYLRMLYKRRWVAGTAFSIVVLLASVYTFTTEPAYDARVQILIEKEDANVVTFKEVFAQNQVTADYYQTQYRILQSRALARRTIDALHLWNHPTFNPPPDDSVTLRGLVSMPVSLVHSWFSRSVPAEPPQADETRIQSSTIDRFLDGLIVSPIRDSRLVDLRYRSPDPELSANIANTLARSYIEQNLEFRFLSSREASDWLGQQLAAQRVQVEATEQALQRYREANDAVSLEERQNIVVQKLTDLNAAVTRAKTERIQKEAAYNQIRAVHDDPAALETLPAIVANVFVQQQKAELANLQREQAQLSDTLGPRHPAMLKLGIAVETANAKIERDIGMVVQSIRNDYEQALAQEDSLNDALGQQKLEALELNRKGIEYGGLARDAAANRQVFESLMQRTKETGISGDLKTSNIRIVDTAETPRSRSEPNVRSNMLLALLGGAALAIGLAFFFEYIDDRIKSPDEVKQQLGLPFLGMVPALFDKAITNPLISNGVPGNFSESIRALRSNLLFSSTEEGGQSIVVTSTGPGEGKTVVATNVAIALAQTGERVLLVDADMRRPRVHEMFDRPQVPGLSNVLVGDAKASAAILETGVPGLSVITAGVTPPNPAELLGSKRFRDFVAALPERFEWVIIDTPPVMAVTDSSVVAHFATGVLFVVGAEMTGRGAARQALEQLAHAHARFIGAVLNRVDVQHNPYYYSQYYRREYGTYYQNARA